MESSPSHPRRQLRRAVASSYFGSVLEYYDFFLYATTAALVFNAVFFPDLDPVVGTIASFGTLAAGYVARPLGGLIFGHFGDRIGRKTMLVWTMCLMAGASTLIGLLPTYEQIGLAAPILLVVLRILQGIALGGEWGGAVLITAEHAKGRRGLWTSFTQAGGPSGMVLSTAVMAVVSAAMSPEQFTAWGWRVPFLFSVVLLVAGLIIRYKVDESPVFVASVERSPRPTRLPIAAVLHSQWRRLLLVLGISIGSTVGSAVLATFVISYASGQGFERQTVLNILLLSSFCTIFAMLGYGMLSDRLGRRPVMIGGSTALIIVAFALFPIIDTGSVLALAIALPVSQALIHAALAGPQASLVVEQFNATHRYTGASVAFQFAGIFGGLTPLVFASILQSNGGNTLPLSWIMTAAFILAIVCLLLVQETHEASIGARADEPEIISKPVDSIN